MKKLREIMGNMQTVAAQMREEKDEAKLRELNAKFETLKREAELEKTVIFEREHSAKAPAKSANQQLREFLASAPAGKKFYLPMSRESISYNPQSSGGQVTYPGTGDYVQGITVVDLISTDRKDGDFMAQVGVPMTLGVRGNKIQWAFAGGVEASFENELAATRERTISLDKQTPVMQRLTLRVRISNEALDNTEYDLAAYIIACVRDAIRQKINWAGASTTKATANFYGGFAQNTEIGTYGTANYVPGKQVGTYTDFSKETAAEMISKLASRNLSLDTAAFVMGSEEFWRLKVTPIDEGSGIMLIGADNRMLGIPVVENNSINRATQKGAIAGHNIGLGSFKYMPVMQHGDIRLSRDNSSATASATDETIVTINAYFSMTVLQDGADAFVVYSKTNS